MNAADFLNNQHTSNHTNLNASDFLNNGKKFKKPSNKLVNDTIRDLNNGSTLKSIDDVTIDDVLYNELDEQQKMIIQSPKKKRKIKKNNKKLFKKYISQQAEKINDSRF